MIRQMLVLPVLEHPLWFPIQWNIILAAISCTTAKKTYGKQFQNHVIMFRVEVYFP